MFEGRKFPFKGLRAMFKGRKSPFKGGSRGMLSEHFGILMDYFLNSEAWQLPNRWFRLFKRRHLGTRDCHVASLLAMTKKQCVNVGSFYTFT